MTKDKEIEELASRLYGKVQHDHDYPVCLRIAKIIVKEGYSRQPSPTAVRWPEKLSEEFNTPYIQGWNACRDEMIRLNEPLVSLQNIPTIDELYSITSEFVEEHFPKGKCKERGKAIVLHAQMLIAICDRLRKIAKGEI